MAADILAIDGVIRDYDWGSRTAIQQLLRLPVDGRPAAELWFGAHPGSPSPTGRGPLDELIESDPTGLLGPGVAAEFGARLPYLLKVLAADTALSIQVHPTRAQAEAGYAAEDAAGIPRDAANRNYRDRNHKPELLCALTPFEALCGFAPLDRTRHLLDELDLAPLAFLAQALRGPEPLRTAFTAVLTHDDPASLAHAVGERAATDPRLHGAALAAEHFPDDVGVVLALLLNHVRLEPGEAIYLGAGNVHAYLRGTGVEIMANSDNVLRCGLTAKHIDVDELLEITDFTELAEPRWPARDGEFVVPVPDFRLRRVHSRTVGVGGPAIALCVEGEVRIDGAHGGDGLVAAPGHALFVPAGCADVEVTGLGFVAEVGRPE